MPLAVLAGIPGPPAQCQLPCASLCHVDGRTAAPWHAQHVLPDEPVSRQALPAMPRLAPCAQSADLVSSTALKLEKMSKELEHGLRGRRRRSAETRACGQQGDAVCDHLMQIQRRAQPAEGPAQLADEDTHDGWREAVAQQFEAPINETLSKNVSLLAVERRPLVVLGSPKPSLAVFALNLFQVQSEGLRVCPQGVPYSTC